LIEEKRMTAVNPIPEGFNTVSPHVVVTDGHAAIEFYKKAFGAEQVLVLPGPDGKSFMYGEVQIGNSRVMLAEENPQWAAMKAPRSVNASTCTVHLYVEDCDQLFNRAVEAGAKVVMPLTDMFWGDRYGQVQDPDGHHWSIATHTKDLTPEEIGKAMAEAFASGECG
jgi:uncharacterized glyoxalase superfamily protein PhnB